MKLLMTLAIIAHIIFPATPQRGGFEIRRVNAVLVESGWKNQTDSCEIVLPRNVIDFDKNKVRDYFRLGDFALVSLGYNGIYTNEFEGYITEVSADVPVKLKLQDEMWKLKKLPVNISLKQTTLPKLMRAIAPNYQIDALDIQLGSVRYAKTTVAAVLKKLKDDYNLYSYFQNGKLVVGKIYEDNTKTHTINLDIDVAKNNLNFVNAADRQIKITAVSTLPNGEKLKAQVGDDNGEERQYTYYNISSESELKKLAELDLQRNKVDGYEGSIECFGHIKAQHGDKVKLISSIYPERNGLYYIDKKTIKLTDSPQFRKNLTIGQKVTA